MLNSIDAVTMPLSFETDGVQGSGDDGTEK